MDLLLHIDYLPLFWPATSQSSLAESDLDHNNAWKHPLKQILWHSHEAICRSVHLNPWKFPPSLQTSQYTSGFLIWETNWICI